MIWNLGKTPYSEIWFVAGSNSFYLINSPVPSGRTFFTKELWPLSPQPQRDHKIPSTAEPGNKNSELLYALEIVDSIKYWVYGTLSSSTAADLQLIYQCSTAVNLLSYFSSEKFLTFLSASLVIGQVIM